MSPLVSASDHALDLPPLYDLVPLREAGDAFAHACSIAPTAGAGALVWVRRYDLAEFAVVLEPGEPLAQARRAIYAGMNALADALAVHAPPERPISFDWPDAIRVDDVLVGGARLGWPEAARDDEIPDWLVFGGMIRTAGTGDGEPGLRPLLGALDELGFETVDGGEIIASFSRHFMKALHEWTDAGFAPVARQWLERLARHGEHVQLADNGDLLISGKSGPRLSDPRELAAALASPSWLDPATGMPWL